MIALLNIGMPCVSAYAYTRERMLNLGWTVLSEEVHEGETEATLAVGVLIPWVMWEVQVHALARILGEDCIAAYGRDDFGAARGFLIGPKPTAWEPFDIKRFILPPDCE